MNVFKPGDKVEFEGLHFKSLIIKPVEGELFLADSNTAVKGVMMIRGDAQRMMFLPDGTIYCHGMFGPVLKLKPEERIELDPGLLEIDPDDSQS